MISDPVSNKIIIKNPGAEYGKWRKENVGVITRHGFIYGKWTVKAKLTELLNKNNMWNGLTNAIWLITMSQSDWNMPPRLQQRRLHGQLLWRTEGLTGKECGLF